MAKIVTHKEAFSDKKWRFYILHFYHMAKFKTKSLEQCCQSNEKNVSARKALFP